MIMWLCNTHNPVIFKSKNFRITKIFLVFIFIGIGRGENLISGNREAYFKENKNKSSGNRKPMERNPNDPKPDNRIIPNKKNETGA